MDHTTYYFKCPHCRQNESFSTVRDRSGDPGLALLLFGGLIAAIIYAQSKADRAQCDKCRLIFTQPKLPASPEARLGRTILVIHLVGLIIGLFLLGMPDLGRLRVVDPVRLLLQENVDAFVILVGSVACLISLCSMFAEARAQSGYRRWIRETYRTSPGPEKRKQEPSRTDLWTAERLDHLHNVK
jgi:hypothetical protein